MTLARDKRSVCCTWFAHDCARATWAYVLETVRDAVRRLQKFSNSAFEWIIIIIIIIIIISDSVSWHYLDTFFPAAPGQQWLLCGCHWKFVDTPVVHKCKHPAKTLQFGSEVPLCIHCRGLGTGGSHVEVPLSVVGGGGGGGGGRGDPGSKSHGDLSFLECCHVPFHQLSRGVLHCEDTVSIQFAMVLARFGDWLEVTMWPILGNLSCCQVFFVKCEELALVIYWHVLGAWVFDLVRTRSCSVWKVIQEHQLSDQVVIWAGFCQDSVERFPDCFPFIQIDLIVLLDEELE